MKNKYIRYELEKRNYSSNCICGVYIFLDENGREKEKHDRLFAPFLPKKEGGDKMADELLNYLNSKNKINLD